MKRWSAIFSIVCVSLVSSRAYADGEINPYDFHLPMQYDSNGYCHLPQYMEYTNSYAHLYPWERRGWIRLPVVQRSSSQTDDTDKFTRLYGSVGCK
ncbi:MAG TPA: hypothetical protein V6C81_24260 [Planktothrix sp.]|jgi:hypothetical protein